MLNNLFGTRKQRDSQWDKISTVPGEAATFGAGCYWGTEKFFAKDFEKKYPGSIIATAVGFMGPKGAKENPTYYEVCMGATGHVEVLQIKYDPAKCSFEDLCKFFFTFHDPTTINRQGNDRGTQYASVIFAHNDEQVKIAQKVKTELQELIDKKALTCFTDPKVATAIVPATTFYPAHEEHQLYLENNPMGYCNHGIRFEWKE